MVNTSNTSNYSHQGKGTNPGKTMSTLSSAELFRPTTLAAIFDRGVDVDQEIYSLREHWKYNLTDRRPGPAVLQDGNVKPTDLDLACLLATLADRKAVVTLPKYLSDGSNSSAKRAQNQQILGGDRRGKLLKLSSNEEYFSFNMLVQDMAVQDMTTGELGAPRYFHVLGKDGNWHPGWESINFVADATENEFIKQYGLDVASQVAFKNFVSPDRWTAFYGQYYLLTKTVIARLVEEAKLVRAQVKAERDADRTATMTGGGFEKDTSEQTFARRTIRVPVFEADVDAPFVATFAATIPNAKDRLKWLESSLSELRFAARATELAWYKANGKAGGYEKAGLPAFVRGVKWEDETIKRTTWRRLTGPSIIPGCSLRYRIKAKDVEISAR